MITTKAQEQEVLNKIVDLLNSLEEDSYVRTAFKGCVEDAQTNINCDFALSYYDRYEHLCSQMPKLESKIDAIEDALVKYREVMQRKDRLLNHALEQLKFQTEEDEDSYSLYRKTFMDDLHDKMMDFCEWADSVTHLL